MKEHWHEKMQTMKPDVNPDRCPLCGSNPGVFHGDMECSNCGEPCQNWPAVQAKDDEIERLKTRVAELEAENERLHKYYDAVEAVISPMDYASDKLKEHFTEDGLLRGDGQWRQRAIYERCKAIDDEAERMVAILNSTDRSENAKLRSELAAVREAADQFRDVVLHSRHGLAETIEDCDQVNAILDEFDTLFTAELMGDKALGIELEGM